MSTCYPRHWLLVQAIWVLVTRATGSWFLAKGHISTSHRSWGFVRPDRITCLSIRPNRCLDDRRVTRLYIVGARCGRLWQMEFARWIHQVGLGCCNSSPTGRILGGARSTSVDWTLPKHWFKKCISILHRTVKVLTTGNGKYRPPSYIICFNSWCTWCRKGLHTNYWKKVNYEES